MHEQLAKVIPLFADPAAVMEPFVPEVHISEEFQESMAEVAHDIEHLYLITDAEEFARTIAFIKERVAGWPDG